jgi:hypothetical protein
LETTIRVFSPLIVVFKIVERLDLPDREAKLAGCSWKEQATRAADLTDRTAELCGSARNTDGSVTVTVALRVPGSGCNRRRAR